MKYKVDGWEISFDRNVHMYCHSLLVNNGKHLINIDCEDLPTKEKTIGIWLHNSNVPSELKNELQRVLLQWANQFEVKFHIYESRDKFVTNNYGAA